MHYQNKYPHAELPDDVLRYGESALVYCFKHLTIHPTGWCAVPLKEKRKLEAVDFISAYKECISKGYVIVGTIAGLK